MKLFQWVRALCAGRLSPLAGVVPGRTRQFKTAPEPVALRPHLLALHVAAATPWMRVRRVASNDNRPKRRAF
jgi:hypothetical protein